MDFAGFNPSHTKYEPIADHHDHERQQRTPDLPKGGVTSLFVPRCHTHPLELVKLQRRPAKEGREAANEGMEPHIHKSHHCSVACNLHWVYHRVKDSVVPVYGYESKSKHAGWADEHVEQGWEIAPNDSKDPFPPDGAGDDKRQHQDREQEVGEGQAEHKLVAQREEVRLPIEGDNNDEVAHADENGNDDDSNGFRDSDRAVFLRGKVLQTIPIAEGRIAAHGQSEQSRSGQDMLSTCRTQEIILGGKPKGQEIASGYTGGQWQSQA